MVTNNDVSSGTLFEFTDNDFKNNPILIRDNKIIFYNEL
jgi:hypothetical protein